MWTSEVLSSDRQPRTEPPVSGALYSTSVPLGSGPEVCGSDRLIWLEETCTQMGKRCPIWVSVFDSMTPWFRCLCGRPNRVQYLGCKRCLSCGRIPGVSENKHANLAWRAIGMDVPECQLALQFIRRRKAMA